LSAGASPQALLGELTALPRPLAVFRGPTSKGKMRGRGEEERKGGGREFVLCPRKKKGQLAPMCELVCCDDGCASESEQSGVPTAHCLNVCVYSAAKSCVLIMFYNVYIVRDMFLAACICM